MAGSFCSPARAECPHPKPVAISAVPSPLLPAAKLCIHSTGCCGDMRIAAVAAAPNRYRANFTCTCCYMLKPGESPAASSNALHCRLQPSSAAAATAAATTGAAGAAAASAVATTAAAAAVEGDALAAAATSAHLQGKSHTPALGCCAVFACCCHCSPKSIL